MEKGKKRGSAKRSELRRVLTFMEFFLERARNGSMRFKGKRYTEGTVRNWEGFGRLLSGYCDAEQTFDDIDRFFIEGFVAYLECHGYLGSTLTVHVRRMRRLCKVAMDYEMNSNVLSVVGWSQSYRHMGDRKVKVYLTEDELNAVYKARVGDVRLMQIRDLFVLGCLSCQRWSDFSRLGKDNFVVNEKGVPVIRMTQQKTGTYVEVPRVDSRLEAICTKYNYCFPRFSLREGNLLLRRLFKKLAERIPSLNDLYATQLTVAERRSERHFKELHRKRLAGESMTQSEKNSYWQMRARAVDKEGGPLFLRNAKGEVVKPKWELISTHACRRTGLTNLYKRGLPLQQLTVFSGHKTERVLEQEYIAMEVSERARLAYEAVKRLMGEP